MTFEIENLIEYIGKANLFSLALFLISIALALYLFYKSFYRLVYASSRTSNNINSISDWRNENTLFVSRIVFYNNGRKTITNDNISNLHITAPVINSFRIINQRDNNFNASLYSEKQIKLDIKFLDSKDFVVIEILHKGTIKINGRISETGKLLNTEPTFWMLLNLAIVLSFFIVILFNIYYNINQLSIFNYLGVTLLIYIGIFVVIRFIHGLLFIPDKITSKFLHTTGKFNTEFKQKF